HGIRKSEWNQRGAALEPHYNRSQRASDGLWQGVAARDAGRRVSAGLGWLAAAGENPAPAGSSGQAGGLTTLCSRSLQLTWIKTLRAPFAPAARKAASASSRVNSAPIRGRISIDRFARASIAFG